jgi:ATP-dependent exoDNAse (exonuclease V) beta subunit
MVDLNLKNKHFNSLRKMCKRKNLDQVHDQKYKAHTRTLKRREKDIPKIDTAYRYVELSLNNEIREEQTFSTTPSELLTKKELASIEQGKRLHEILEHLDFKTDLEDAFDRLGLKEHEKSLLRRIRDLPFMKDIEDHIRSYKEYEFAYERNGVFMHGIIDLVIEFEDRVCVVDYKLKDISKKHYEKQVLGYVEYLKRVFDKPVEGYLYSIVEGNYRLVW